MVLDVFLSQRTASISSQSGPSFGSQSSPFQQQQQEPSSGLSAPAPSSQGRRGSSALNTAAANSLFTSGPFSVGGAMDVVGEDEGPSGEGRDGDDDDDDEVRPLAPSNGSAASASSTTFPPAAPSSSLFPPGFSAGRRTSVSAESLHPKAGAADGAGGGAQRPELPTYPKSPQQLARIRLSIASNFLFRNLDDDQSSDVLSAMKEVRVGQGEVVIRQGDVGDYFYVVEEGQLEVFKSKDGEGSAANGGLGDKVATTGPGMSFGELALMYKCVPSWRVAARKSQAD